MPGGAGSGARLSISIVGRNAAGGAPAALRLLALRREQPQRAPGERRDAGDGQRGDPFRRAPAGGSHAVRRRLFSSVACSSEFRVTSVARAARLLEVLHLLTHLLDQHLELDGYARQGLFLDFGRERVRFAVELLNHEVQPPPDGSLRSGSLDSTT